MSTCDLLDLVLTVTVESRPLDSFCGLIVPIPFNYFVSVFNAETATFVGMRQANNERCELGDTTRSIDMSLKFARGTGIDLQC